MLLVVSCYGNRIHTMALYQSYLFPQGLNFRRITHFEMSLLRMAPLYYCSTKVDLSEILFALIHYIADKFLSYYFWGTWLSLLNLTCARVNVTISEGRRNH